MAVRLPHETITEVDRLAKTLGLSSRSEAIRYMIVRSAATMGTREIKDGPHLEVAPDIRSKERKCFQIDVFERARKWRASIRRSDGSKIQIGDMRFDVFIASVSTSTADHALQLARRAIDTGAVQ